MARDCCCCISWVDEPVWECCCWMSCCMCWGSIIWPGFIMSRGATGDCKAPPRGPAGEAVLSAGPSSILVSVAAVANNVLLGILADWEDELWSGDRTRWVLYKENRITIKNIGRIDGTSVSPNLPSLFRLTNQIDFSVVLLGTINLKKYNLTLAHASPKITTKQRMNLIYLRHHSFGLAIIASNIYT